jgi:ribonuclease-3
VTSSADGLRADAHVEATPGRKEIEANLGGILGFPFDDPDLWEMALTHRSYAFEEGLETTNERLEFLGDAVLGLVITDLAFRQFPDLSEGDLAKLRAATVKMSTLADVARELDLGTLVRLGRGEEMSGGRDKPSILADCMEAVLGAVYLDRGLDHTRGLIEHLFWPRMEAYGRGEGDRDHKMALQELASRQFGAAPEYRVASQGPDHAKEFTASVFLRGERYGGGQGRSKKEAEQQAAREALDLIASRDVEAPDEREEGSA